MATVQNVSSETQALLDSLRMRKDGGKGGVEEAQDRFLTLLVTQMKSQDPLNPLDNAQVTSQLAQISTVTGIDKLNETLKTLSSMFSASQSLQAAALIGRGILAEGSGLTLQDGVAVGGYELSGQADKVTISIKDAAGRVIHSEDIGSRPAGSGFFQWDGIQSDGTAAPAGQYSFSVEAVRAGSVVGAKALAYGAVDSVNLGGAGVTLNVRGLGLLGMDAVKQIL
jgi:flagellar basal-body rod modification protein FlgD